VEDDPKRPYAATANVMAIIERTRTRNLPDAIDDDLFRIAGIGPAVFGRVRQALQFLNLVRQDNTPTDLLRALSKAPEQEYRQLLESAIRDAYAADFEDIDPAQDSQLQIFERFRRYEPRSQTNRMVMLFLGMCREAGISVKDAPRERKMQAAVRPKAGPKPVAVRGASANATTTGQPGHVTQTRAMPAGILFGVSEDDIAVLGNEDFAEVWTALGKVARARSLAKAARESAPKPVPAAPTEVIEGDDPDRLDPDFRGR